MNLIFKKKTELYNFRLKQGPAKTKIQVYINSVGLPTSIENNCYHYIEIRDYLPGAKGKLYVIFIFRIKTLFSNNKKKSMNIR